LQFIKTCKLAGRSTETVKMGANFVDDKLATLLHVSLSSHSSNV
jgi:hypothetical protein